MAGIHAMLAGAGGRIKVAIPITGNNVNYVLNTSKVPGYATGNTDVIVTIESGAVVGSVSTGSYGFTVDGASWHPSDKITLINKGYIVGMGGGEGSAGGPAFVANRNISIDNSLGVIGGGGGGGGYGNGSYTTDSKAGNVYSQGGGGGGGAGYYGGSGGPTRTSPAGPSDYGYAGGGGSLTSGGGGGGTGRGFSGSGGAGGGLGSYGGGGNTAYGGGLNSTWYSAQAGGPPGAAIIGNSNITWISTGSRLGGIS
jgi:hypothetical protein